MVSWPRPNNVSECTENAQVFDWSEDLEKTFAELKRALVEAPVLGYPDPNGHFIVDTDASAYAYGLGAVLSQIQLCYEQARETVLRDQKRASCGSTFTIRTDHAALRWLLSFRSPEGQVAR